MIADKYNEKCLPIILRGMVSPCKTIYTLNWGRNSTCGKSPWLLNIQQSRHTVTGAIIAGIVLIIGATGVYDAFRFPPCRLAFSCDSRSLFGECTTRNTGLAGFPPFAFALITFINSFV